MENVIIICSVIALAYSVVLVLLIDRYIPQLLGKFRTARTIEAAPDPAPAEEPEPTRT